MDEFTATHISGGMDEFTATRISGGTCDGSVAGACDRPVNGFMFPLLPLLRPPSRARDGFAPNARPGILNAPDCSDAGTLPVELLLFFVNER